MVWPEDKKYKERSLNEPVKFLFLPEMGLLGSLAGAKKSSVFLQNPTFGVSFHIFMDQKTTKNRLSIHYSFRTKTSINTKVGKVSILSLKSTFLIKIGFF